MFGHDECNGGPDESELNHEGVEVWNGRDGGITRQLCAVLSGGANLHGHSVGHAFESSYDGGPDCSLVQVRDP